jgi:sugar phosphate isomerase/epimerase
VLFGFSTGCLYTYPLYVTLRLAKRATFDGVELMISQETAAACDVRLRAYARTGAPIHSVHVPLRPPFPSWREPRQLRLKTCRIATLVGAQVVVLHGGYLLRPGSSGDRSFRGTLMACHDVIAGTGVRLSLENNDWHVTPQDDAAFAHELDRLARYAADNDLGVTLDTGHLGGPAERLIQAWDRLGSRIVNVHCNNAIGGRDHQRPEHGDLGIDGFLRRLQADGYSGLMTFETHPRFVGIWWPPLAKRTLERSLAYCRAVVTAQPTPGLALAP